VSSIVSLLNTLSTRQEYHSLIIMRMVESSNNSEAISNVVQFLDSWSSGSRSRDNFTSYVYPEIPLCSCSAKEPAKKKVSKQAELRNKGFQEF
jgi:hypothetical protein